MIKGKAGMTAATVMVFAMVISAVADNSLFHRTSSLFVWASLALLMGLPVLGFIFGGRNKEDEWEQMFTMHKHFKQMGALDNIYKPAVIGSLLASPLYMPHAVHSLSETELQGVIIVMVGVGLLKGLVWLASLVQRMKIARYAKEEGWESSWPSNANQYADLDRNLSLNFVAGVPGVPGALSLFEQAAHGLSFSIGNGFLTLNESNRFLKSFSLAMTTVIRYAFYLGFWILLAKSSGKVDSVYSGDLQNMWSGVFVTLMAYGILAFHTIERQRNKASAYIAVNKAIVMNPNEGHDNKNKFINEVNESLRKNTFGAGNYALLLIPIIAGFAGLNGWGTNYTMFMGFIFGIYAVIRGIFVLTSKSFGPDDFSAEWKSGFFKNQTELGRFRDDAFGSRKN